MMLKNQCSLPQTRDPFQNLFTHLFRDSLGEFYGTRATTDHTAPRTNICETDTAYELSFELPGTLEQDIQVQLHDKVLTVQAERKDQRKTAANHEEGKDGKRWHRVEHTYGRSSRSISLPSDAADAGIEAVYKQGVLTVTVPKQAEAQPAKITVRTA